MHSIGPSELVLMFIIYLYYNACMYGGGLKEMPCFRTHIKLVVFGEFFLENIDTQRPT
jgi:hypothetical protein